MVLYWESKLFKKVLYWDVGCCLLTEALAHFNPASPLSPVEEIGIMATTTCEILLLAFVWINFWTQKRRTNKNIAEAQSAVEETCVKAGPPVDPSFCFWSSHELIFGPKKANLQKQAQWTKAKLYSGTCSIYLPEKGTSWPPVKHWCSVFLCYLEIGKYTQLIITKSQITKERSSSLAVN